jgi:hypothetical protein
MSKSYPVPRRKSTLVLANATKLFSILRFCRWTESAGRIALGEANGF